MKILVTGGRAYADVERLEYELHEILKEHAPITHLIQGGATGADWLAAAWAWKLGIQVVSCNANWDHYGKGAGAVRNRAMLGLKPDLVIAFPGGVGTAHMVRIAKQAKFEVREVI